MIGRGDLRVEVVRRVPRWALCCDFDPGHRPPPRQHVKTLLARAGYTIRGWSLRRSMSGKGWHLVITTRPRVRSMMEVVALQAVLGSDAYREACNVLRARQAPKMPRYFRDVRRVSVLYEGRRVAR